MSNFGEEFYDQRSLGINKNKLNQINLDSDDTLKLTTNPNKYKNNNKNTNEDYKKITTQFPFLKNLPHIFSIIFFIFLVLIFLNFSQNFYQFCLKNPKLKSLSEKRLKIKYISEFFSESNTFSKVNFLYKIIKL
jgi:hypothetical protein